jgi:hypothetical protein
MVTGGGGQTDRRYSKTIASLWFESLTIQLVRKAGNFAMRYNPKADAGSEGIFNHFSFSHLQP